MKIPGFRERTTTTTAYDPTGGDTVRATDTTRSTVVQDGVRPAVAADGVVSAKELQRELHTAYERGKRDQRAASKGNPILTLVVVLFALLGVAFAVLAAANGSFREAGETFDGYMAGLRGEAAEAKLEVQDAAGETAQDVGAAIQDRGAEVERAAETPSR